MFLAARAIFLELHPIRIIAAILLGGVIPLFAVITLERNDRADIFLFGSHCTTLLSNLCHPEEVKHFSNERFFASLRMTHKIIRGFW
jgi:hypothetical protein